MNTETHRTTIQSLARHARRARLVPLALACAALHLPAAAADHLWNGSTGAWGDPARWSLLGVPGLGDRAIINSGTVFVTAATGVGSLVLDNSATLTGPAELTVGSLAFERGTLGSTFNPYTPGRTVVTGSALFNGGRTQEINTQHELVLQGASRWTAGNGAIEGAIFGGVLTNSATGFFRDEGAVDSASSRRLFDGTASGGGSFFNQGTYFREGNGTTILHGLNNTGLLRVQQGTVELGDATVSSGTMLVATAGTLRFNGPGALLLDADISGRIDNDNGCLLVFQNGNTRVSATGRFDGHVQVLNGKVDNAGTQSLRSLRLDGGGQLSGTGQVTTQTLDFRAGTLGGISNLYPTGGTTVSGDAVFDGARNQRVSLNHTLTLQGNSVWTAGQGVIGGSVFGGVVVNAAGATFRDEGAAGSESSRRLFDGTASGGGTFVNEGSFVRSGEGTTRLYGFNNQGLLQVQAGTAEVHDNFSNLGRVHVAAGAVLASGLATFSNAGTFEGLGMVRTFSPNHALVNAGVLSPGTAQGIGSLTVLGDLNMTESAVLRIELGADGLSDRLVISDQVVWGGSLSLVEGSGFAPAVGDSFVIASFAQRLADSQFGGHTWSGTEGLLFAVDYGATDITVRVTAVPEPGTWLLMLAGVAALRWRGWLLQPLPKA
jgi:hypothetical protein